MSVDASVCTSENKPSLLSLFWTFLKIGSTAFGGFMALISVVQNYLVDREKLLSHDDMLDGISLATILPGPVAVNVVAYAGYRINGVLGAIVCATAVTLPSFFLILFLSYAYFAWGDIPAVNSIFQGFLPAVAAIIIAAVFKLGSKTITGTLELSVAISAMMVLIVIGGFYSTLLIIVFSGVIGWVVYGDKIVKKDPGTETVDTNKKKKLNELVPFAGLSIAAILVPLLNSSAFISGKLLATFAGMSVLLFGGGFVFIPLMQETVVETYGWVTQKEFIDAIAKGQITPGPILISATFIGYKVAGVLGAVMATIGIFVPPAMIMLVCTHYLQAVKSSTDIQAILKGIRCGVIGMIAAAAYVVGMSSDINTVTLSIFGVSLFALLVMKLEVVWIIPVSGVIGLLAFS